MFHRATTLLFRTALACTLLRHSPLVLAADVDDDDVDVAVPAAAADALPDCAQDCFATFLDQSYGDSACGTTPTLPCLCAQTGLRGYTVGEGALACLALESSSNSCQGENATASASAKAYEMCAGQTSAAAETHATLVATLVVQLTTTTTTATATTMTSAATAPLTSTSTSSSLSTSAASSATTKSFTVSSSTFSSTSSSMSSSTSSSTSSTSSTSISTSSIVGIAVGATAGFLLLAGIYLFVRRARQQRLAGLSTPYDDGSPRSRDSTTWRPRRHSQPHEMEISMPLNLDPRGLGLANFGLADSRYAHTATTDLRVRPNGPPPAARMAVPQRQSPPWQSPVADTGPVAAVQTGPQQWPNATPDPEETASTRGRQPWRAPPPQPERESIITEFAEDGEMDSAVDRQRSAQWPRSSSQRSLVGMDDYGRRAVTDPTGLQNPFAGSPETPPMPFTSPYAGRSTAGRRFSQQTTAAGFSPPNGATGGSPYVGSPQWPSPAPVPPLKVSKQHRQPAPRRDRLPYPTERQPGPWRPYREQSGV